MQRWRLSFPVCRFVVGRGARRERAHPAAAAGAAAAAPESRSERAMQRRVGVVRRTGAAPAAEAVLSKWESWTDESSSRARKETSSTVSGGRGGAG